LDNVALLPGFVNSHSHLELTAMRGFLDKEEQNFFSWLRKLTTARSGMSAEELYVSAMWGACEAARAGITCLGDSSDSAATSLAALKTVGLRGIVFQESFGPDPRLVADNFQTLLRKVSHLRNLETPTVQAGVSPHAPYTVCAPQLEMIAEFARTEHLPLMMHAAESRSEELLLRDGTGPFADGLAKREIPWHAPEMSTIEYLEKHHILETEPLLAHCINVDDHDLRLLRESHASIAHCPRSNAKLGHGRAPLREFLRHQVTVGLGTDSVASNNSSDILAEARFAILAARSEVSGDDQLLSAEAGLRLATAGGAAALGLSSSIGTLNEGMQADFVALSLEENHQLPSYDPISTVLFASSGHDVKLTVVAGKEVYADGRVTNVNEEDLRQRVMELAEKLAT
jgi:5-methylthioadenosine/S-adenosylhomocysteine deaminase